MTFRVSSLLRYCAFTLSLLLLTSIVSAEVLIWDFTADEQQVRNGPEADGSTNSPGTGTGRLEYDFDTNILSYEITWDQLFGEMTRLHIHGAADENTSTPRHVVELLGPPAIPPELATTSGSLSGSFVVETLIQDGFDPIPASEIIDTLVSGDAYVNFHTTVFGTGEIRGNVGIPVPEPSSTLLSLMSVIGLAALRKRVR